MPANDRTPLPQPPPEPRKTQAPSPAEPDVEALHLAKLYREMLLIRRVEEESARGYAEGKIGGFLHLYIGQEAVGVGAIAALRPEDYVITTYRDHGIALAKGMSARALMAELFGKATGCSQGPRRLDAHVRQGAPHARRLRHRRRPHPAGRGRRLRLQVPRRRPRHALLLRRRRGEHRRVPRGALARGAVEAADRLHLREQRVLDGHAALALDVDRGRVAEGARLRDGPRPLLRRRRARGRASHRRGRPARARAELADARRGAHLPLPRPLDERPGQVPHARPSSRSTRSATRCSGRASGSSSRAWATPELEALEEASRRRSPTPSSSRTRAPSQTSPCSRPTTYNGPFAY